jgi:cobalamin biosynthesis Mg chelatase CobN
MWNEVNDIYFHDKYRIGVTKWFQDERHAPAMINMTSILLTAANKGFWKASPDTIHDLANTLGLLVVRYGPSCSAHSCGNYQTIAWTRQWMNPTLAASYSRAMKAALSGTGYPGAQRTFSSSMPASAMNLKAKRPLFDFTVEVEKAPVTLVQAVFQRIRNQDFGGVFLSLVLILVPAGVAVFFVRDRYHRRRGGETIQLTL